MSGPVQTPLRVQSIDGSVSGRPITTIKVTNGDLTVSGDVATIDTSGGGGGGMTSFDLAGDSGATQSIGNGDTLSVLGGTGLASVAGATDTVTLNIENTLVSGTTPDYYDALTINAQGQVTAVAAGTAPQEALTLTTTGTSGAATLSAGTLNIPQYSGGSATPAGSDKEIQFNDSGSFGADAQLLWDSSNDKLQVGQGVGYPRVALAGNNGFVYFQSNAATPVTNASIGTNGTDLYLKSFPTDTERLRITTDGSWGIEGANYGTSGQVLTSGGSGSSVSWTTASGGVTFPLEGSDGSAAAPTYSFSTESSTGLFLGAAGRMEVSVGGVRQISMFDNRFRFDGGGGTYVVDCDNATSKLSLKSGGTAGEILIPPENEDIEIIPAGSGIVTIGTGSANMEMGLKGNSSSAFLRFQYNANTQLSSYSGVYLNANQGGGGNDLVRLNGQVTSIGKANVDTQLTTQGTANMVIDTNNGTSSGAITITDGANGNITVNPDGTGTVGLGNFIFDVDQTVGASQDAYVLTYTNSTGEISLKEAGGGGGGGIGIVYPPVTNSQSTSAIHWGHISAPFGTSNQTSQTFSTDSPCWIPIIARRTATFTDIAIQVTSGAGSTSNVDLGIYSDDSGEPGTLLGQATVDVDTSGEKTATLAAEAGQSLSSVAGTQYWLAMVRQAGVGSFTMQAGNKGDVGQWAWTPYATSYGIIVQSGSDNTLPASATFSSGFAWNTLAIGVDYE